MIVVSDTTAITSLLKINSVKDHNAVELLRGEIDAGEAEAIILAEEFGADVLLIDEKDERFIAEGRGIRCLGLAGAVRVAKQNGLISSVREILEALETKANFYLDAELKRLLLRRASELS